MTEDEELAGAGDQDDFGGLPASVMRWTKPASAVLVHLALSAHMESALRRRWLPMCPGLYTDEPELCSLGERPAKAARAFGGEVCDVWRAGALDTVQPGDGGRARA